MRALAIVLIVIGVLMATITGYDVIRQKRVADVGPIHITKEERTPVYWNPWSGVSFSNGSPACISQCRCFSFFLLCFIFYTGRLLSSTSLPYPSSGWLLLDCAYGRLRNTSFIVLFFIGCLRGNLVKGSISSFT